MCRAKLVAASNNMETTYFALVAGNCTSETSDAPQPTINADVAGEIKFVRREGTKCSKLWVRSFFNALPDSRICAVIDVHSHPLTHAHTRSLTRNRNHTYPRHPPSLTCISTHSRSDTHPTRNLKIRSLRFIVPGSPTHLRPGPRSRTHHQHCRGHSVAAGLSLGCVSPSLLANNEVLPNKQTNKQK
jgi:hypothetical protein